MSQQENLSREWATLQNNYEAYEKGALTIKLVAVVLYLLIGTDETIAFDMAICMALLWIIEAMFRTYQSRLGERLLRIEAAIHSATLEVRACQLHSEFQAGRGGIGALLGEYVKSAVRPGVAFPYPILIVLALWY